MKARTGSVLLFVLFACGANVFGQETSGQGLYRLSWPGKDWALDVSLADFDVTIEDMLTGEEHEGYWLFSTARAKDKRRAFALRIRLEPGTGLKTSAELRDFKAARLKKNSGVVSLKTFEHKQISGLRYRLEAPSGFGFTPSREPLTRSMDAFLVKDDVWITVAAFSPSISKEDEELFYQVLDSIKFTGISHPSSSFDYFYKGKAHLDQKQLTQAANAFTTAINLERKQRRLDDTHWRTLVGYLVDLCVAAGKQDCVKEMLEYGISNQPAFPLFHLGLAHYYAGQGDVGNTIAALEKAYLYRKNDRRTMFWIDPMKVPAFERFRKDETFRKAAKAMK